MGSFKHPRFFDPTASASIRSVYYEIMDELEETHTLPRDFSEQKVKAAVIRELLKLFTYGTPVHDWKSKVLSNLPLG